MKIFLHKIIHDIFFKFLFKIHYIIWNIKHPGNTSGIINGRKTATAAVFFYLLVFFILPNLHHFPATTQIIMLRMLQRIHIIGGVIHNSILRQLYNGNLLAIHIQQEGAIIVAPIGGINDASIQP